jgi:SAM-dependent methyltransferase
MSVRMWAAVADAWTEHAEYADARGGEVTARMLAFTRPAPGERLLELAGGAGGVGLAAAPLVGPAGEVVLTDAVPALIAAAADRAAERRLANVRTALVDLDDITLPDAAYDVVVCREGFMFAREPERTARELRRILRPDGRFALAVWGPRVDNPWLGLVFDAVEAQLGQPMPPPGVNGPFALADADRFAALLRAAGLDAIAVTEVPVPLVDPTFDAWWTRTSALAGPLAARVAGLSEQDHKELRVRLEEAVRPYGTGDGLSFPGLCLLATGRRLG